MKIERPFTVLTMCSVEKEFTEHVWGWMPVNQVSMMCTNCEHISQFQPTTKSSRLLMQIAAKQSESGGSSNV